MSNVPDELGYTKDHEWARKESDGRITVGITDFAQSQLGDVVYLNLPEAGTAVTAGEPMGEIESTKSVSDVYAPVSGTVVETNSACVDNPEVVNQDPYGVGWMVVIEASDASAADSLLRAKQYQEVIAETGGDEQA